MCDFNFNNYDEDLHFSRFTDWAATRNEYLVIPATPEQRHEFAYRAAFQAASVRGLRGFNIAMAQGMIEAAGLFQHLDNGGNDLPDTHAEFDEWHQEKRKAVIGVFNGQNGVNDNNGLSHGRAAKLINVYLKAWFPEIDEARRSVIHPPVDSVLLTHLRYKLILDEIEGCPMARQPEVQCLLQGAGVNPWRPRPWTTLDSPGYNEIIHAFQYLANAHGLWKIEKYWPGPD